MQAGDYRRVKSHNLDWTPGTRRTLSKEKLVEERLDGMRLWSEDISDWMIWKQAELVGRRLWRLVGVFATEWFAGSSLSVSLGSLRLLFTQHRRHVGDKRTDLTTTSTFQSQTRYLLTQAYYSSWRQCENWTKRTGGGVICRKNVWNFAHGLKFKAVFHSKTSVCRHELGRVQPPSPTVLTLVDAVWSVSQQLIHITTNDFIEVWMSSIHVRK